MPKTFGEQERELIRQSMLNVGSQLLRKKGIRQVSVEDLTKGANIAKGSFYSFYNSREELFWDIIKMEENLLLEQIKEIAAMDLDMETKIKKICHDAYLKEGSIAFYLPSEDVQYIMRKLPPEIMKKEVKDADDFNHQILTMFQLDTSKDNIEFMLVMEKMMCFACSNDLPQSKTTRQNVVNLLVDAFSDYFCNGDHHE